MTFTGSAVQCVTPVQLLRYITYGVYHQVVWDVDVTLVEDWLLSLDGSSFDQVVAGMELLAERGPALGRPLVDSVVGSRHRNLKELRPGSSGRSELRLLFAFDPQRRAIVLVAGDKAGNWKRWYRVNIPLADARYDRHLASLG